MHRSSWVKDTLTINSSLCVKATHGTLTTNADILEPCGSYHLGLKSRCGSIVMGPAYNDGNKLKSTLYTDTVTGIHDTLMLFKKDATEVVWSAPICIPDLRMFKVVKIDLLVRVGD